MSSAPNGAAATGSGQPATSTAGSAAGGTSASGGTTADSDAGTSATAASSGLPTKPVASGTTPTSATAPPPTARASATASTGVAPSTSGNAPCPVPDYIFGQTEPVGWASQSGGTDGGGTVSPKLVTTLAQLQSEVSGNQASVLYVQGDFAPGVIDIGSNKTIIGCTGVHVRGRVSIGSKSSNVILRNLDVAGYGVGDCALDPDFDPGTGCSSGSDAVGVNGDAHHVWIDHCSIHDGTDGNLDITNDADFVTVSWSKFSYAPRRDDVGDDSTGAAGHRYSNLVGGTDSEPTGWPNTKPLNVTWHHNWWADNVVERQPRVRYGQNHLFNNYYDSATSNYCVRAGIEASILLQSNYFASVKSPHQFNSSSNQETAFIALGKDEQENVYDDVSGDRATGGGGTAFEPPYTFEIQPAADVPATVQAGAGCH